jgi:predicted enzyme related to lactoylglutathione lyase
VRNPVVHFKILGSDGAKLTDFSREVFDWPLEHTPLPGWPTYGMMEVDQGTGGAVRAADAAPDAGVLVYVEVDDLGAYLDRTLHSGATLAMPVTNVASTKLTAAWIRDPQGHLLGLVNRPEQMHAAPGGSR